MVSYMTNDPSACVHLGPCVQWTLSTSDGVPLYSLCQDEQQNLMTSCYSLLDGEDIEDVTCADGSGYTVADNEDEDSYEFFSLNTDLHLGWTIGVHFFQTHFDLNLPCPRWNSSNHRPVLLLHDHRISFLAANSHSIFHSASLCAL